MLRHLPAFVPGLVNFADDKNVRRGINKHASFSSLFLCLFIFLSKTTVEKMGIISRRVRSHFSNRQSRRAPLSSTTTCTHCSDVFSLAISLLDQRRWTNSVAHQNNVPDWRKRDRKQTPLLEIKPTSRAILGLWHFASREKSSLQKPLLKKRKK